MFSYKSNVSVYIIIFVWVQLGVCLHIHVVCTNISILEFQGLSEILFCHSCQIPY